MSGASVNVITICDGAVWSRAPSSGTEALRSACAWAPGLRRISPSAANAATSAARCFMSGGLLPPFEDTGSEAEYAYDESDDREQSSRRRDVLVLGIGRGEPQGLSVDPIRQLRGRRRLHRELGVVRVLDGVECRF